MEIIKWIIFNILYQNCVVISLIALVGLALQKKPLGEVISGTMKTMLGFLVLSAGSGVISNVLTYFGDVFQAGFHMTGLVPSIEAINGQAMGALGYGGEIALSMCGIFIANLLFARFTKFKYVFLTGQVLLFEATITVVFGHYAGLNGVANILLGALIGGLMCTMMPAVAQPYISKITESDDIALGHLCTIGYLVSANVGKLVSKITGESTDVEEIEMPKVFEFLQDTYLSVMAVMVPLLTVVAAIAGPEAAAPYCGSTNYVVYGFLQGVEFAVGVYIVMAGVRMLLAEIVPAFRGIAMKAVPGAIPALDCPVLFPYSPNAVIVGFLSTTVGSIIGMFLFPVFGLPVLLPGMMTNFFAGGTAGIFGNKEGGFRGCVISGVVHGLFITLLPALLAGMLTNIGFVNATCTDSDIIITGLFYGWAIKPIAGLFMG